MSILIRSSDGETVVDQDWIDARYGSELPGPDVRWRAERGTYSADLQVIACPASGCSLDDQGRIHLGTPHGEPCQADLDIPAHRDPVEWRAEFDLDSGSCTVG